MFDGVPRFSGSALKVQQMDVDDDEDDDILGDMDTPLPGHARAKSSGSSRDAIEQPATFWQPPSSITASIPSSTTPMTFRELLGEIESACGCDGDRFVWGASLRIFCERLSLDYDLSKMQIKGEKIIPNPSKKEIVCIKGLLFFPKKEDGQMAQMN